MYGFLLFSHLTSLMIWVGAIMAIVVMLLLMRKQLGQNGANALSKRIISVFNRFAHPAAFVVLVSGVIMIIRLGMGSDKPFWLDIMEKGGGTIILLFFVLTGILGSKLKKRLSVQSSGSVAMSSYLTVMASFFLLIVALVLIVSLKL